MDKEKLVWWISHWLEGQGWAIEAVGNGKIEAVMSSGYGSGPAVISVTDLAEEICNRHQDGLINN